MKKCALLLVSLLLAIPCLVSAQVQTNYVTSFTGATNIVAFGAVAASNQWNYLFVHLTAAARVSFDEATTTNSPIYVTDTVWTFGRLDRIPTINARTTNSGETVTINIAGRVQ